MMRRGWRRINDRLGRSADRGGAATTRGASGDAVLVIGAGVGGLLTAMSLARDGAEVTVVERDEVDASADLETAFATERRGAPQRHQTHGFLGRLRRVLADHHPEVLADLEAAGGTAMSMAAGLGEARPGDDDLQVLVVRRTTFEHMLRRRAESNPFISFVTATVTGLRTRGTDDAGRPIVDGVALDDGRTLDATFVVATTGSRSEVTHWLADIGVDCPEESRPSGLVYLTRWYRRSDPDAPWEPRLFGHLPYVKVLGVPGDGGSLSITLAVPSADATLRGALSDADRFDRACRLIPTLDQFFGSGAPPVEPLGEVRPMGGLLNRRRRFVDEQGQPLVIGFHALGDAHTTTNPIFGRGCSLAAVQSSLLVGAHRAHPADPAGRSASYEAACRADIDPWYENSLLMEMLETDEASLQGRSDVHVDAARFVGAMFMLGAKDPLLGRGLARYINLLRTPAQLMADRTLMARVMELADQPGAFNQPPAAGPTREELLNHLGVEHSTEAAGSTSPDAEPLTAASWPGAIIHPTSTSRQVVVGEIDLHVVEAGPPDGPPVLLLHGFPELAYSWRHQIPRLADAGYRVVAVDQRGFGRSGCPSDVDKFDIHHLTGDLVGLLDALAIEEATLVAHDWGSVVADAFTVMHPERVTGLLGLSVPLYGRLDKSIPDWIDDALGGAFNHVRYFQAPGVADAELDADVAEMIYRVMAGPIVKGDETAPEPPAPDTGLIQRLPRPDGLPAWLSQVELDHFIAEFTRTGFTGGLSWYRNLDQNWETTAHHLGVRLAVPTAFVTGQYDVMNLLFPPPLMEAHVSDHRFSVTLEDVGHWVQQEAPERVTELVLRFLAEVSDPSAPPST